MCTVDFYILESSDPQTRLQLVCRLSEKAWHGGYKTFILTESPNQQKIIDDLLWTFRPGSFVPHGTEHERLHAKTPVVLGDSLNSEMKFNLLINLQSSPLDSPHGVERIIEVVDQNEQVRRGGRQRYRHYQESGKKVGSHRVSV